MADNTKYVCLTCNRIVHGSQVLDNRHTVMRYESGAVTEERHSVIPWPPTREGDPLATVDVRLTREQAHLVIHVASGAMLQMMRADAANRATAQEDPRIRELSEIVVRVHLGIACDTFERMH